MKIEFLAGCLRFAAEQTKAPEALVQALQNDVDFTTKLSALVRSMLCVSADTDVLL